MTINVAFARLCLKRCAVFQMGVCPQVDLGDSNEKVMMMVAIAMRQMKVELHSERTDVEIGRRLCRAGGETRKKERH